MDEQQLVGDEQTTFKRADDVEEIALGKRIALYPSGSERVVILNKTGSILWKRLETAQSRRELVKFVQTQFSGISEEQLASDVSSYLHELICAKCVEGFNTSSSNSWKE